MLFLSDSLIYNLLLALITLAVCLYLYFTSTFNYWKDRGIPYAKPIPFFGNLKGQFLSTKHVTHVFQDIYDELKGCRYGGYFEMRNPVIMIRDPDLVQQVLVKDFTHFYNRGFPADPEYDPLSANLSTLEGGHWKYLRNKLTPTFTTGKLKGMFEQICNCGDELVKSIEELSKTEKALEIKPVINNFALDVIASCAFGLQMDKDDEVTKTYQDVVTGIFKPSKIQAFRMALFYMAPKIARKFGIKSIPDRTEKVIVKIIRDTINFRQNNNINRNDFLQLILNLKKQEESGTLRVEPDLDHDADDDVIDQMKYTSKDEEEQTFKENHKIIFSDTCIAAQSFVFLVAGSESASSPLSYALYELTKNPKVQEKAHKVIDTVLKNHNNQWSYQAVKEMTYIDQILQETFRIHPIGIVLFRTCSKAYKIPDSNHVIEKGTRVVIPIHAIHNDPDNYKSPEVFDPDRFVDNNFKPSGKFLPFGDGPRICIAMRFAILELTFALAKILSHFNVKRSSKTKEPLKLMVTSAFPMPEGGLWLEFEKRKTP